ncbi:GTP cyclohydrolase [Legionella feeleii]|uniref:NADPH-dependent 7-cyano-7-deazaguanine reductase n=2 Tax=Legionella feeleii TaxID=453 RepID=A0A378ITL9_9GAMM|nr:GTP cyclohydrolase [Legionella feeleii]
MIMARINNLENSPLGKKTVYSTSYDKSLLFGITRRERRQEINIPPILPFHGEDIWNAYEFSWLNCKGKPVIALATFIVSAESPRIFESKSLKLYLHSFNASRFNHESEVSAILCNDLSEVAGAPVLVTLQNWEYSSLAKIFLPVGINLDHYDLRTDRYTYAPEFLETSPFFDKELLYSNLLKSNCPITSQPDWATLFIHYEGRKIKHEGLLKYIISLRNHDEFHEHCVERIFMDILNHCKPEKLLVYARYTRRGGIDINPQRATPGFALPENLRQPRQ